jgi:prepilin-type N-terminal cleavage/methylation domain-containing protein/prepilin-type processing-associated H-X9-DG protein
MKSVKLQQYGFTGFTLLELLVAMGVIALLATMVFPVVRGIRGRADAMNCQSNLRQIWAGINSAATDNNNKYPTIKFGPDDAGADPGAKDLPGTLSPYGIDQKVFQCAADLSGPNWYAKTGTSYLWQPMAEEEALGNVRVVTPWRTVVAAKGSRVRLLTDYEAVHEADASGRRRMNVIYVDGHVVAR